MQLRQPLQTPAHSGLQRRTCACRSKPPSQEAPSRSNLHCPDWRASSLTVTSGRYVLKPPFTLATILHHDLL